jgi:hypothetical protein
MVKLRVSFLRLAGQQARRMPRWAPEWGASLSRREGLRPPSRATTRIESGLGANSGPLATAKRRPLGHVDRFSVLQFKNSKMPTLIRRSCEGGRLEIRSERASATTWPGRRHHQLRHPHVEKAESLRRLRKTESRPGYLWLTVCCLAWLQRKLAKGVVASASAHTFTH